jgi:hypothetical protein
MSDPWFKFFPEKWRGGVAGLKPFERSVYIDLLAEIYENNGPIENNTRRLSRLCGTTPTPFKRTLNELVLAGKLSLKDGKISNPKADILIKERDCKRRRRSEAAKKSSLGGKNKISPPSEKPQQNQSSVGANAHIERERDRKRELETSKSIPNSSSSKSVSQSANDDRPTDDLFESFWKAYPHSQPSSEAKAKAEWEKLNEAERALAVSAAEILTDAPRGIFAWTWLKQREWIGVSIPDPPIDPRTDEERAARLAQLQAEFEKRDVA